VKPAVRSSAPTAAPYSSASRGSKVAPRAIPAGNAVAPSTPHRPLPASAQCGKGRPRPVSGDQSARATATRSSSDRSGSRLRTRTSTSSDRSKVDWVYRTLAGIAPDADAPGYRHVVLAPRPVTGIDRAAATVESALGPITAEWTTDAAGTFTARYSLPFGVTASFSPPADEGSAYTLDGRTVPGSVTMGAGRHDVTVPSAQIISPADPSIR
jgi:Bacterial alpha-L-rhamnosidase C-terminal domain